MSYRQAEARIRRRTASLLNVRAEALRSEVYGVLEAGRIGRGRVYTVRGRRHVASAPGDAPARLTGRLMESIKVLQRASPSSLLSRVGPDPAVFGEEIYPFFLEYGTRKMAPRSFMRRGLNNFRAAIRGGRT
jgi:hypothetical protein